MDYLPLFLALRGRPCLVVGGGDVALRKLQWLVTAGAQVKVIAPVFAPELATFAQAHGVELLARAYAPGDVDGQMLVIAATDNNLVNTAVYTECQARNIFVNTVDNQALCSAIFPAIIRRDPVLVAVSTGGAAPTLARLIRGWIEAALPAGLGALADFSGRVREKVRAVYVDAGARRQFWDNLIRGPIAGQVYAGQLDAADAALQQALAQPQIQPAGFVSLVGAGPGDPELLTLRALRAMQQADVVLHDALVSPAIMELVRRDANRILVGKRAGQVTSARQEHINAQLIQLASAGKRVVRLKGGDPFVFGRAGEEIEALVAAGIAFEVIPGITAATGCAAYAGIPLTHRDWAQSVRFITARRKDGSINLPAMAPDRDNETLVVYMGVQAIAEISAALLAAGMAAEMPTVVVINGTLPNQRLLFASLGEVASASQGIAAEGPATLIVGRVVALHELSQQQQVGIPGSVTAPPAMKSGHPG